MIMITIGSDMNHEKRRCKRLETFEMWIWGRVEKLSWTEQITN